MQPKQVLHQFTTASPQVADMIEYVMNTPKVWPLLRAFRRITSRKKANVLLRMASYLANPSHSSGLPPQGKRCWDTGTTCNPMKGNDHV